MIVLDELPEYGWKQVLRLFGLIRFLRFPHFTTLICTANDIIFAIKPKTDFLSFFYYCILPFNFDDVPSSYNVIAGITVFIAFSNQIFTFQAIYSRAVQTFYVCVCHMINLVAIWKWHRHISSNMLPT